jgi:hypothetical protein
MELSTKPILPGSFVVVKDTNSIYRGYKGFVQRVTKKRARTGKELQNQRKETLHRKRTEG